MKKLILFLLILSWAGMIARAQVASDHYYAKIVVPKDQELIIYTDSLYLDTLILESNSKLVFSYTRTRLIVENAFVSDNCLWDASGKNGIGGSLHGEDGADGNNLILVIVFRELKSLSIRTNGGNGGNGYNAMTSNAGFADGGDGGNGGNGGLLELHYSSSTFIPTFNESSEHSIFLSYAGGNPGQLGYGRKSATRSAVAQKEYYTDPNGKIVRSETPVATEPSGVNGTPGSKGKEGRLVLKRFE